MLDFGFCALVTQLFGVNFVHHPSCFSVLTVLVVVVRTITERQAHSWRQDENPETIIPQKVLKENFMGIDPVKNGHDLQLIERVHVNLSDDNIRNV